MSIGERLSVDIPHRSAIAWLIAVLPLKQCLIVVEVLFRLGQQEYIFVSTSRSIFHALGHGVWLVPHNVASQIPTVLLQRESQSLWYAEKVFRFQTFWSVRTDVHSTSRILLVRGPPSPVTTCVSVTDVQPENTIILHYASSLIEQGNEAVDILRQGILQPDLAGDAVIAQTPIGWRCHNTLH